MRRLILNIYLKGKDGIAAGDPIFGYGLGYGDKAQILRAAGKRFPDSLYTWRWAQEEVSQKVPPAGCVA